MDIRLNGSFDVTLDDRNDLGMVSGREEFEQNIAVQMTTFFLEEIGSFDHRHVYELLEYKAKQIVGAVGGVEGIVQVAVSPHPDHPNTANVTVIYESDPSFTFSVSE